MEQSTTMRSLIVAMSCVVCVALATWAAPSQAQTAASGAVVVTLTDGSTLKGELLGANADRLEVRSSMGTLRIPLSRVASVARDIDGGSARGGAAAAASPAEGAGAGPMAEAIAGMRSQLTANPATLQKLMALSDNADIMALVLDPEVQRIIQSNDLEAAARSEKIKRLMARPELQAIVRDFQAKHAR